MENLIQRNVHAYRLLFQIEVALRRIIQEELFDEHGTDWLKHLPGDAWLKCKEAVGYERRYPWNTFVPHPPIFYIDFPHLKQIITERKNWGGVFQKYFGNKQNVDADLSALEPIRNRIAHSRIISDHETRQLEVFWDKLRNVFGDNVLLRPGVEFTSFGSIKEQLKTLKNDLDAMLPCLRIGDPLSLREDFGQTIKQWWFDESYLMHPTARVARVVNELREYASLPRGRGTGHQIERWLNDRRLVEQVEEASAILGAIGA